MCIGVVDVGEGMRPEDIRIDLESYIGVYLNICQVWVLGLGLDDLLTDQTEEFYTRCAGIMSLQAEDFHHPFTPYEIQLQFMRSLYASLEEGKVAVFESPTGKLSFCLQSVCLS